MSNLETIDLSIFQFIRDQIKPIIKFNQKQVIIPLVYAKQELWNMIKTNNYLLSKQGKIQVPVMSIRRVNVNVAQHLANKRLYVNNYQSVYSKPLQKPRLRDIINGQINKQQYLLINTPTFVQVQYQIMIWTNYISHSNRVLQTFLQFNSMYWGGYKTNITSNNEQMISQPDQSRLIKLTIGITVLGRIDTDHSQNNKKVYGVQKVQFKEKTF